MKNGMSWRKRRIPERNAADAAGEISGHKKPLKNDFIFQGLLL